MKLRCTTLVSTDYWKSVPAFTLIYIVLMVTAGCGGGGGSDSGGVSSMSSSQASSSQSSTTPFQVSYGSNALQIGDLRLPTGVSGPVPLVIIIHGGCWISAYANFRIMDKFADAITALGYATWNIEYRAIGTGGEWPVIFQDVGSAIDYSNIVAQQHNIDLNKVAVIGHSAGGHLALWAASRSNIASSSLLYTTSPLPLRGVISLGGIADVTRDNSCYSAAGTIIGLPLDPMDAALSARLQETSPRQMLPIHKKSILITGTLDNVIPTQISTDYVTQAISLGDDSTHYTVDGAGHFDLIDPDRTDWALYKQSLQAIFKE